jgi:DNA-binding GntR family transcriptional regulator
VRLDPTDRRPVFRQVADQLRQAITSGAYGPGDKLPSGRLLADEFGVAPGTIASALNLLREEGLVASWQGRGFYVLEPGQRAVASSTSPVRLAELEADVSDLRRQVGTLRDQVADLYGHIGAPLPRADADQAARERTVAPAGARSAGNDSVPSDSAG